MHLLTHMSGKNEGMTGYGLYAAGDKTCQHISVAAGRQ